MLVVEQANTVDHPDAIVVHLQDTSARDAAVVCTLRLPSGAALAEARATRVPAVKVVV